MVPHKIPFRKPHHTTEIRKPLKLHLSKNSSQRLVFATLLSRGQSILAGVDLCIAAQEAALLDTLEAAAGAPARIGPPEDHSSHQEAAPPDSSDPPAEAHFHTDLGPPGAVHRP